MWVYAVVGESRKMKKDRSQTLSFSAMVTGPPPHVPEVHNHRATIWSKESMIVTSLAQIV